MDQVIADKVYVDAKSFIQEHITGNILSDETKNKFVEYYNNLTLENAKSVHAEVTGLYSKELKHLQVLDCLIDFWI